MHEEHASWLAFLYEIELGPFDLGPWHVGHFHLLPHWVPESVPFAVLCALILGVICYLGTRRMEVRPRGAQGAMETIVSGVTIIAEMVLEPRKAREFAPFVGTLFIFILLMNLFGLIPGMKSATADLNTTAGLAIIVFLSFIHQGIKVRGVLGYLKHMVSDVLGLPWILKLGLVPAMLLLHMISEFVRPVSLSIRLFGNIMGKEVVLGILFGMGTVTLMWFGLHVAGFEVMGTFVSLDIPPIFGPPMLGLAAALMPLAILMGFIQALVFSLLAALYISLATESEAEHEPA